MLSASSLVRSRNPSLQVSLGLLLRRLGEQKQAVEHLRQALELNPNHVEALACMGEILLEEWRVGQASELIEKAIVLGADSVQAAYAEALLREAQNRQDCAIEAWQRAMKLDPKRDRGAIGLAKLLRVQGHESAARGVYQNAHNAAWQR